MENGILLYNRILVATDSIFHHLVAPKGAFFCKNLFNTLFMDNSEDLIFFEVLYKKIKLLV